MNTKETLRNYIKEVLLENRVNIDYDTTLIDSELLDSLTIAELIAFIEERFEIAINDDEFDIDHFNCINTLATMIDSYK